MKTYEIEVLPDEPIVITRMLEGYKVDVDMPRSDAERRVILDQASEPMFLIVDVTQLSLSMGDIISVANKGARGEQALWHHPMIREMIFVTSSPVVELAVQGLDSPAFGNLNARIFGTLDEALSYARTALKG